MGMSVGTSGSGRRMQPTPNVNVTPLVDVALVVLIIFMVMTPMMTKTFWLNLPKQEEKQAKDSPPPSSQPLVMKVLKDGRVRVNSTILSKDELGERLPRMLAAKNQKVLYFDAEDDLPYGVAVEAMDTSRASGARSIAILTKKLSN